MMETHLMVVGSAKADGSKGRRPRIRLAGFMLDSMGFKPDMLVAADYGRDCIVLKLHGEGLDTYKGIVRQLRTNRSGLLQVKNELHNRKRTPHIEVRGFWLEPLGFTAGSIIAVQYEYGLIRIKRIDLERLVF
jgi:HSP20-like domain of unknown function (DUF1813).